MMTRSGCDRDGTGWVATRVGLRRNVKKGSSKMDGTTEDIHLVCSLCSRSFI